MAATQRTPQYFGKPSAVKTSVTKTQFLVPAAVKATAVASFKLRAAGFGGGHETGWKRAKQLATEKYIPAEDLRYMRNWFARHVVTSYPAYLAWKKAGKPTHGPAAAPWKRRHGIVAWEIWGGDAALAWVNTNTEKLNRIFGKSYKHLVRGS